MAGGMKRGVTRRTFSGLAVGGLVASAFASPAAATLRGAAAPAVDLLLFDDRFSDASRFAGAARAEGVATLSTGGDLGALWYAGLRHDLGSTVRRIAGMGRHSDFWIMRQLAADKGMELRFHAEHDFRGRKVLTHRLPAGETALGQALASGTAPWSTHIARHLARGEGGRAGKALTDIASATPAGPDHPGLLVTWLFA